MSMGISDRNSDRSKVEPKLKKKFEPFEHILRTRTLGLWIANMPESTKRPWEFEHAVLCVCRLGSHDW